MTTQRLIPGYGRQPVTLGDFREFRAEAERKGHVYHLHLKDDPPEDTAGVIFQAQSLREAKEFAAWYLTSMDDDGNVVTAQKSYTIVHQGKIVYEHTT